MSRVEGKATIVIGDRWISNELSFGNGVCHVGTEVVVKKLKQSHSTFVGVEAIGKSVVNWGNLEGDTPPGKGWYFTTETFIENFTLLKSNFVVANGTKFNGVDISGMKCRLLSKSKLLRCAFVELECNVGGGSADGGGRTGHCVPLPESAIVSCK